MSIEERSTSDTIFKEVQSFRSEAQLPSDICFLQLLDTAVGSTSLTDLPGEKQVILHP